MECARRIPVSEIGTMIRCDMPTFFGRVLVRVQVVGAGAGAGAAGGAGRGGAGAGAVAGGGGDEKYASIDTK